MLVRRTESVICFSSDDGVRRLLLDVKEFADVSWCSASTDETEVIITAARERVDTADVMSNKRGRYLAYRLSTRGIEALTKEYTNTAIFLPQGGIAYSNGNALVVESPAYRHVLKMGKFSWGPPSLSTNENGSHVGVVKWKGDDRKLMLCDAVSGTASLSKFSLFSYVLVGTAAYFEHGEVRLFEPLTGAVRTVSNVAFKRELLRICGLERFEPKQVGFRFSRLTMVCGKLHSAFRISDPDTFEPLVDGVVAWLPDSLNLELAYRLVESGRWLIEGIESTGKIARVTAARFEHKPDSIRKVETKTVWIGPQPSWRDDPTWSLVGSAQTPNFGFQFLPG